MSRGIDNPCAPPAEQRRRSWWELGILLILVCLGGCRREDVRPWMICYRIYEHCRITFGSLTQKECEAFMATKPSSTLDTLVDCTRDKLCPGIISYCFKEPVPRRR